VQPGSLESEAGIYACTFDKTGTRFITCEVKRPIIGGKETHYRRHSLRLGFRV